VHRRRRLIVALLLAIVVGLLPAVALAFPEPARLHTVGTGRPARTVVVGPEDTLWDLAKTHAPSGQGPLSYLAEIIDFNDVKATALQPGMVLRLP
jgi:hypothetical protein